ncbi:MAG: bifunctional 23S rRNA (guanine(2069)-N(7))-methyltransferase RlmK/23S rRNA (guanine(2445)-N(2))-methyltransferase RlmL [Acidobacteriia bacterium]|nr:bifunctional 23S rRNA (guanine(2069)-N(7))-methyltransferase RlmK/23S rRNA (guanine(2445)-N(2))-methyltransferase RlmL [Terriglobia bacterium]
MALRFFATASRGTERVLADELGEIGIRAIEERRGGVAFGDTLEDAYRACLWSRVASRVLLPLTVFEVDGAEALYQGVHAVDWIDHVGPERTMAVDVAGGDSPAGPPHFVALKTKDAVVDRVREAEGARPDVDTARPDLRVNVHLAGARVTVSLDLAGGSLHHRGIDRAGAAAPLKENLAAALLRIAGWPALSALAPMLDPLCGSGTILIEAAWMALDVAPGLERERIGAEGWRGHDSALWDRLRAEARDRREAGRGRAVRIAGSDASRTAVKTARENLERAGVARHVRVELEDLRRAEAPWPDPGLVVTNPPYGARLGEAGELGPLYELLGDVLKRRFPGWTAWVLSGNPALAKRIGLKPASRHILHNGPIECRLLELPIAGPPVSGERGPAWRKPSEEAGALARKLVKNRRDLAPWAERLGLTCYRLYDTDMPEYNLAIDWYDGAVRVEEYAPPRKVPVEAAERRLRDALLVVPEALGVDSADVVLRVRRRRVPGEQHERRDDRGRFREVREGDLRFLVNLTDYLDTGLFLDDRLLRRRVRERAAGRDFLNLFAYTCAATVAAAAGGARTTTSVDLSNVYLAWGRRNLALNGLEAPRHRFVRADVVRWLAAGGERHRYDLILVAPPTHSRSKGMAAEFDVQRDHATLIARSARRLAPGGEMLFSTNLRGFVLDEAGIPEVAAREITEEMTPPDFARRPRLRAWELRAGSRHPR